MIDRKLQELLHSPWQLAFLLIGIFTFLTLPILFGVYMTSIGYALMGEIIIGSTGMLFNIFLLSSVYNTDTVIPVSSSIPYASLLYIRVISYSMLGLWIPAFASAIGAIEWTFLCLFRNNLDYE